MNRNRILLVGVVLSVLAQTAQPAPIVPPDRVITSYTLSPEKLAKATALYRVRVHFLMMDTTFGFVLLLSFLYGRAGARFRAAAERVTKRPWLQGLICVPLPLLTLIVLLLPLEMYGHHLSLSYGLSVQRWGSWSGDWARASFWRFSLVLPESAAHTPSCARALGVGGCGSG